MFPLAVKNILGYGAFLLVPAPNSYRRIDNRNTQGEEMVETFPARE